MRRAALLHALTPEHALTLTRTHPAQVKDRLLALFEHRDAIYAVDGMCYHAGGPLAQADLVEIEELDNRPCVVCPWHHYMIMLDSGEGVYRHVEPGTAGAAAAAAALRDSGAASANSTIKSKGRKQRIHPVRVRVHTPHPFRLPLSRPDRY